MLRKAFKNIGTVVGEAIVALVGIGTIYGLGWMSGCKSGAKFNDLMNKAMSDEEKRKAAEAAASKEEDEPANEPDKEQQQEEDNSNELPEVEFD